MTLNLIRYAAVALAFAATATSHAAGPGAATAAAAAITIQSGMSQAATQTCAGAPRHAALSADAVLQAERTGVAGDAAPSEPRGLSRAQVQAPVRAALRRGILIGTEADSVASIERQYLR